MLNKLDKLQLKGLRIKYFRKPNINDFSIYIENMPMGTTSKILNALLTLHIGTYRTYLNIDNKELLDKVCPKVQMVTNNKSIVSLQIFVDFIEGMSLSFHLWQFINFLRPIKRLISDDLNAIPKYGCLTEEGKKELKKLHQIYNSINGQINNLRDSFIKIKFDTNVFNVSRSNMGTDAMFTAQWYLKIILSKIKILEGTNR